MTQLNDQVIQEIFESLTLNIKLSQDLLNIVSCETKALREMNTQELLRISKHKNTLLSKIQFIDESLKNHLKDNITAQSSSPSSADRNNSDTPKSPQLSGLIELFPKDKAAAATQCKNKLNKIRQNILIKNYINKKFTEDTLGYLGEAITLFTKPVVAQNTYTSSSLAPKNASSLPQLISKEV